MIHILLTINNNYVEPSMVTLNSLFTNNHSEKFYIHILHYDLVDINIERLQRYINSKNANCSFYLYNKLDWANGKTRYWDKIVLLKLYAWLIIPKHISKILYLDSDVLVLDSIRDLWDKNLSNYYFAMRGIDEKTDISGAYGRHISSGHTNHIIRRGRKDLHYSAGVILMNLSLLRHDNPNWEQFYKDNYYRFCCPEEHLICMLWYEKVLPLDNKWNQIAKGHSFERPVILHYIPKPWSNNSEVHFLKEYLQYCNIPECNTLFNSIISKINAPYPHSKDAFLCSWIHVEIKNPNYLKLFMDTRSIKDIVILGINEYSNILSSKIATGNICNIVCYCDDNPKYCSYNEKDVVSISELSKVSYYDAVIVTNYEQFSEIEYKIRAAGNSKPIISLIEIIFS